MLSPNTQVTLLLTAPLITGQIESPDQLTSREYTKFRQLLAQFDLEPAVLISSSDLPHEVRGLVETDRYQQLLGRRSQLTQAVEFWTSLAIWVAGQTDEQYPKRFIEHMKDHAPPIVYGCGDTELLNTGGLAVVGSRDVDPELVEFTENVGRLGARAHQTLISGGARGIDQAAMRGAAESGGKVIGVLADSLEHAAVNRGNRELLTDSRLTLITVFDPSAGFNVGHAMQRNRLIYALGDAALVVNSDVGKGGTWTGAIEQLEKLHFVPVYVRSTGQASEGLKALQEKGASLWPNPTTPQEFLEVLARRVQGKAQVKQLSFL